KKEESQRQAQIFYYIGLAHQKMGNQKQATDHYKKAATTNVKNPAYNYEKALALQQLKQAKKGTTLFQTMMEKGEERLNQSEAFDFFSKFGGREGENIRLSKTHQLIGLAALGQGNESTAKQHFEESVALHPGNYWARSFLEKL
ncbi:MAG: hypothetical protein AAGJ18_29455, partial [Bacteroidota bacterium]